MRVAREIVTVRVDPEVVRRLDVYVAGLREHAATTTRSDAVRRLLDLALTALAAEGRR